MSYPVALMVTWLTGLGVALTLRAFLGAIRGGV